MGSSILAHHWKVYSDGIINCGEIYGAGFVYSQGYHDHTDDTLRSYDRYLKR